MTTPALMAALRASIATALPNRVVLESLPPDPMKLAVAQLKKGAIAVVSQGGGNFLNYQGREGDGGDQDVMLVGYVQVAEKSTLRTVEDAELALFQDVLTWAQLYKAEPLDSVVPLEWQQSQMMQHPFGWLTVKLKVRWV